MNPILYLTGLITMVNLVIILMGLLIHDQMIELRSLIILMRNDENQS